MVNPKFARWTGVALIALGAMADAAEQAAVVDLPILKIESAVDAGLNLKEPTAGGSRLNLTPLETPASIEVLSGETIRARGDALLVDAITRAVGFSDVASPGNGGTAIAARGFSGHGSVMQLYDGTRLYVGSGTITFPFDPWSVDRIEVLHGPASVLYGEGAIGGAVNIVPKKATREASYQGRLALGTDDIRRASFGATGPLSDRLAYRFDISHNHSNGWVDNGDSESLMAAGSVRWDLTDELALTLSHDEGRQQPMRYFGVPLRDGRLDSHLEERNFNVVDSVLDYEDKWTRINLAWQPSEAVSVTNQLYRLDSERHWRNAESYSFTPAGLVRRSSFLEILHDQEQIGNRFNVALSHSLFGFENDVSFGFNINRIDFTHSNNSPYTEDPTNPSLVDPLAPTAGYFVNLVGTSPRFDTETTQHSLFVENRFKASERLALVAGLRYDNAEFDREDLANPAASFDKNFYSHSWRIGAVYDFADDLVIYGQYATGSDHLGSLITTSASQVDFDLATGQQWEIGLKQSLLNGRGQWTLAYYDITKKKLLSRDADNPGITVQIGERSARGLEAAIAFDLGAGWRIDANAAVLEARFDDFKESVGEVLISRDGNIPDGVPERTANLWLSWQLAPDWRADAGARYVGTRYSNTANTVSVDAYTVFDVGLQWQTTDTVGTSLRLFNVTDEVYTTSSNSSQWRLAQPRTVELAVDFRF